MRFFAHAQPGLGLVLADEAGATQAASDGRNDIVFFETRGHPPDLRCAEDVFVQAGHARGRDLRGLPQALTSDLDRALSVFASAVRPLRAAETFRTIVRVRSERDFLRSQLRDSLTAHIARVKPKWRPADPSSIELWAFETSGEWVAGLRLSTGRRSKRTEERHGALRPSVAAAMVRLAGSPGRLLDPFCGTGTIVEEARATGWHAFGADIDPNAIALARHNTRCPLVVADAQVPPFREGSLDAIVANLPFGKQYAGPAPRQVVRALEPLVRRRLVLLTARGALKDLKPGRELRVRVLGQAASLWTIDASR